MREVHWKLLQYITGIGIFFLVGYHLLFSHFQNDEITEWSSVSERAVSAGWFTFYVLILIFGIYHVLHGIRGMILEFSLPDRAVKVLNYSIVLIGVAIFGYAVYIPINGFIS